MARLILVRHGETEWNRTLRYQGQTDVELNENGIWQAGRVAERLAGETIDFIYSSDLSRARRTAEIIAERLGLAGEIQPSALLREMHFGEFEGMTFKEMEQRYPNLVATIDSWRRRGPDLRAPNGESIAEMAHRVELFVETLSKHRPEETILIVAHGGSLQVLLCHLLEIDLVHWWKMRLSSATVSILETYPEGTMIHVLNDSCHLR